MNFTRSAILLLAVIAVLIADAKHCQLSRKRGVWKHKGGTFHNIEGSNKWIEYNGNGEVQGNFEEVLREGTSVVIGDAKRGVDILLRTDLAGIRHKGEQQFQQLYSGGFLQVFDCT